MQLTLLLGLGLGLLPAIFSELITTAFKHLPQDKICGSSHLTDLEGMIVSPNYPSVYPNHTSCTWIIISPVKSKLTISVTDFDIEEDTNCNHPPCCLHTWLSLPKGGGRKGSQKYCGSQTLVPSVAVTQNLTFIKFHTSKVVKGGRGFRLKYHIAKVPSNKMGSIPCASVGEQCSNGLKCVNVNGVFLCEPDRNVTGTQKCAAHNMVSCGNPDGSCFDNVTQWCDGVQDCLSGVDEANCGSRNCYSDELLCRSGNGCYKIHQKCDMKMDCSDFSDEINCGLCADGLVLCSPVDRRCFSPNLERCNGKLDCLFGEDEVGCAEGCREDEVACSDGGGCYPPPHRCDLVRHCRDGSDELGCPPCGASPPASFPCDNGRCVAGGARCDGAEDCGDGSDERGCLPTSVVTLAIVGSLAGGLALVLAAGWARRLHGGRPPATTPPPDRGFFHREPPPAYTATPEDRPRRTRSLRTQPRPQAPAGACLRETSLEGGGAKADSSPSSSTDSPGRESATSSTSLVSCNDDTELLIL